MSAVREDATIADLRELAKEAMEEVAQPIGGVVRLRDALQSLVDEQNGPPLIRDADSWCDAMIEAADVLSGPQAAAFYREMKLSKPWKRGG